MIIEDLEQGSPEWHLWRQRGIGGSEASVVMDENDWMTEEELLEVKLGKRVIETNEAMLRGHRLEPEARMMYQQISGIEVRPVCAIHPQFPWIRASLDGLSRDGKTILEIKCPGKWPHHRALFKRQYPRYYHAQMQHELMATVGAERVHYFSYRPDDSSLAPCAMIEVLPDPEYQRRLFRKESEFMMRLQRARGESQNLLQQVLQPEPGDIPPKPLLAKPARRKSKRHKG